MQRPYGSSRDDHNRTMQQRLGECHVSSSIAVVDTADTLHSIFQVPWQRIVNSVENMAQSHETLASKIQADVESPLRLYSTTNREIQSMGNMSGNLSSIAKDLTNARRKAQKLDAKGGGKAEGANSKVDGASSQWESQAPFVFEQLQALDEARINHLRDVLTQYQTHELDQVERGRASAESCLNALLNIETADEIKTFAAKAKSHAATTRSRRDSLVAPSLRSPGGNAPPTPPPPRTVPVGERTGSFSQQDRLVPLPETPKEKKLSGLKRLGTVMGRRKNAAPPPLPSEKKKESRKSFAPFRRQESSRSFQGLDSTGRDLTPVTSQDDRAGSRRDSERPPQTQESRASDAAPPPALNGIAGAQHTDQSSTLPQVSALQPPLVPASGDVPRPSSSTAANLDRRSAQPDPFAQAADTSGTPAEESARNFEIKDQPIPEDAGAAQLAMDNMANQLRIQAQSSGLNRGQGTVRGRRDVRNTMFIPNPPQQELPSPIAATQTAATLSTPTTASTAPPTTVATSAPAGGSTPEIISPVKRSLGTATSLDDPLHAASDTHSVHSAHSTAGMAHHQEMHAPGLNASIVETVNTWFSDEGVIKSFVIGEVALAYNRSVSDNPTQEVVRLQNYHQLEKCAANPVFVTSLDAGEHQPGTYNISVPSIARPIPSVAFKYQLHLDDSNLSAFSPLLITQAWQIVDGQANVILLYSLNPSFAPTSNPGSSPAPQLQELLLKNVSITVSLNTDAAAPKAISAQMMPVQNAHFKKRSSAVVWRLPELLVKPTQERLLVRFMVENNGVAKRGDVNLKFEVPNMLASALGVERLLSDRQPAASDPFADDEEARKSADGQTGQKWEDVQSRKLLVSGKYNAS